ncbi:MAG: aldose 1-epimerase [Rhodospirillales bacterium]|nr:aldose 1-epimerase [Rhodospirillales bacterium]
MLTLRAHDASLLVAPASGGAIAGWARGPIRLLRMPLAEAVLQGDVHGMACFPLLPYANRIGHARFPWAGTTWHLRPFPGHLHALHGVGWKRPWEVAALSDASVRLTLRHDPSGPDGALDWPFAFTATQEIALEPDRCRITLSMTNRHAAPAPAGLGLHPYFPAPGAMLQFDAGSVWQNDATNLPRERTPIPAAWTHAGGQPIGAVALDNCFVGWRQPAVLRWPTHALTLTADPIFDHLQVYTPPGQAFFAVEPVSHAPDALNHAGAPGMRVLAPDETLSGSVMLHMT